MIRITSNMSQSDVAARTGLSFQQIQKYENGVNRISAGRLLEFCVIFDTTPHELLGWQEKKINAKVNGETVKLVQAFAMLPEKRKPLIRSLIEGLLRE
jgi:transcriptional regulator with XRE-family HTH domain